MIFELLLVSLTAISGLIWLTDYLLFKLKEKNLDENNVGDKQKKQSFFVEQ